MQASAQASARANRDPLRISNLNSRMVSHRRSPGRAPTPRACSGTGKGFSPSGPSGSLAVSPGITTTYGITCTGAGGSASQSVTVTVTAAATACDWHDGRGYRHDLRLPNSNAEYVRDRLRGVWQPGRGHWRSSEQRVHMVAGRLRRRPYRVDYSERSRGRIANCADPHVQRESSGRRPRRLVDAFMVVDQRDFLQRNRLLSIRRLRICLSLADCKHHVQHHLHGQRRIDGSNQRR